MMTWPRRRHARTDRPLNTVRPAHPLMLRADYLEVVAVFHARQKEPKQL